MVNSLPVPLTSFIGREQEIVQIKSLLASNRLLTLTGAGGCGKTRLALQVAGDFHASNWHDIGWVELAALADPALVVQAVAAALGVREQADQLLEAVLAEALRPRKLLLVLDNCEHLVVACADLTEKLLWACPDLRILATSREALGIAGETTWRVPTLSVPDTTSVSAPDDLALYSASRLFIERARAVSPGFALTREQARSVAHICQRLDGVPLAIELAAARINVLSVEQIGARLDDCFALLTAGKRTALPRHQTLRAAIDWSYDLLSEEEQRLFYRLAVFAGGCTLEAVEGICTDNDIAPGAALDLLAHLVDKSLVQVEEYHSTARYRLLETIRRYALEKLQAQEETLGVQRRHRDWYLALAIAAEPSLVGQLASWVERLEREHDNIRAALAWSLEQEEAAIAAQIGSALWRFWLLRGYLSEGRRWLEQALAGFSELSSARANALFAAGILASYQGDYQQADHLLEQSLALGRALGDQERIAFALLRMGMLAHDQGRYTEATGLLEESLVLMRAIGNIRARLVLASLGINLLYQGEYKRARELCEESLALAREHGDTWSIAGALTDLGLIVLEQGDYAQARALCEKSLAIRRQLGDRGGSAHTLAFLGRIALRQGALEEAWHCYQESLALRRETGEQEGIATALEGLAEVAAGETQAVTAVQVLSAAAALRQKLGVPHPPPGRIVLERTLASLREHLDTAAFADAWAHGQAMPLDESVALAAAIKRPSMVAEATTLPVARQEDAASAPDGEKQHQRFNPSAPAAALRIFALGPARVERGEEMLTTVVWTYAKSKELLWYLLAAGPRTKEQIGLALWPDASAEQLRSSFHSVLHHLRRALGQPEWIVFEKDCYHFNRSLEYWYDVEAFESLLAEARSAQAHAPEQAISSLEAATKLYRGVFLEDLTESEWHLPRQQALQRALLDAFMTLGQLYMAARQYHQAAETYQQLLRQEPYLEAAHRELMRCYARQGERGQAMRQYQRLAEMMRDELVSRPAPESRALIEQIRHGEEV